MTVVGTAELFVLIWYRVIVLVDTEDWFDNAGTLLLLYAVVLLVALLLVDVALVGYYVVSGDP